MIYNMKEICLYIHQLCVLVQDYDVLWICGKYKAINRDKKYKVK